MSDVNEGPTTTTTETVETQEASLFANLALGNPPEEELTGQPEGSEAVEPSEASETAKDSEDKPAESESAKDEGEEAPEESEGKPEDEPTVDFDGFSDGLKATWERLFKEGHVTKEEVEEARKGSMFQSVFTKKTQALAEDRKGWEKEKAERQADLDLLDKIRADDHLHNLWIRFQKGDLPSTTTDDDSDDGLVSRQEAQRIADERYEARRRQEAERGEKERREYSAKEKDFSIAIHETMQLHSISEKQAKSYLEAFEQSLPPEKDPILSFTPEQVQRELERRHEVAQKDARIAALEKQLNQKASKATRASKQSLPPTPRVARSRSDDPWSKTMQELDIEPDMGNVQGLGLPNR